MFPSSGYFRGVSCPYFVLGYCDRPHCHFRHVKPPEKEKPAPASSDPSALPMQASMLNMMGNFLKIAQSHLGQPNSSTTPTPFTPPTVSYNATPIQDPEPELAASKPTYGKHHTSSSLMYQVPKNAPKYNPTPLRLLKKTDAPTGVTGLNGNKRPGTIPYDPNSNFSVNGVGGERVTLGEATKRKHEEEEREDAEEEATASKIVKTEDSHIQQQEEKNDVNKDTDKARMEITAEDDEEKTAKEKVEKKEENIFDIMKKTDDEKVDKVVVEVPEEKTEERASKEKEEDRKHHHHKGSSSSSSRHKSRHRSGSSSNHSSSRHHSKSSSSSHSKKSSLSSSSKSSRDHKSSHSSKSSRDHRDHKSSDSSSSKSSAENKSSLSSSSKSAKDRKSSLSSSSKSSKDRKSSRSSSSQSSKDRKSSRSSSSKPSKKHEIERSTSNIELFGNDSDEERKLKAAKAQADSDSDDLVLSSDSDTDLVQACDVAIAEEEVDPEMSVGKKRVAHASAAEISDRRIQLPNRARAGPTPSQVMMNRMREMQRRSSQDGNMARRLGQNQQKKTFLDSSSGHSSDFAFGSNKRVAHVPKVKVIKRPIVAVTSNSKVPTNVRQRYLNVICERCLINCPDEEEAYEKAVAIEQEVYDRSLNRCGYLNKATMAAKKLADEAPTASHPSPPKSEWKKKPALSHEANLGGKKAASANFTLKRSSSTVPVVKEVKGLELYHRLEKYILTADQLKENGFPYFINGSGIVTMKKSDRALKNNLPNRNERLCSRCGKRFMVLEDGRYERQEQCCYHWGKSYVRKVAGSIEHRFSCCGQDSGAKGCELAKVHVHDINRYNDVHGYVRTLPCDGMEDEDPGVYALDCEMVYTRAGLELARVTVIDENLEVVLEKVIKPERTVIDWNTRFSGMTRDSLKGEAISLKEVQAILLSLFTEKTILMGHSLESDFLALKLVHPTVVDTSVVFPHRLGPPKKRALKTLCSEILMKIIQDNGDEGHDSREDASACMELMSWKVKEDMKHRKH